MKAIMSSLTVVRSSGMGDIGCENDKLLLYAVRPFAATSKRQSARWRRSGHQSHKHAVETLAIQVKLDFDLPCPKLSFSIRGPSHGVPVGRPAIQVNRHETSFDFRDDARVDPGCRGQFVPHDVGTWGQHGEFRDVAGHRCSGGFDLLNQGRGHLCLHGYVSRGTNDLFPWSA